MGMFRGNGGGGITGVVSAIVFEAKAWNEGKSNEYSTLSAKVSLTPDGAQKPVDRFIRAGFFYPENQTISKDGSTLSNGPKGGAVIQGNSDFARLIGTLIAKGFPEDRLDKDGLNFSAVVGTRLTLANEIDAEATAKFGKRKGADGKEYSRDYPVISAVLGLPAEKAAGKKAAAKAEASAGADVELADATIVALLKAAKKQKLEQGKLKSTLVKFQMDSEDMTRAQRDGVYETLTDSDYLKDAVKRGVIEFDTDEDIYSAGDDAVIWGN